MHLKESRRYQILKNLIVLIKYFISILIFEKKNTIFKEEGVLYSKNATKNEATKKRFSKCNLKFYISLKETSQ